MIANCRRERKGGPGGCFWGFGSLEASAHRSTIVDSPHSYLSNSAEVAGNPHRATQHFWPNYLGVLQAWRHMGRKIAASWHHTGHFISAAGGLRCSHSSPVFSPYGCSPNGILKEIRVLQNEPDLFSVPGREPIWPESSGRLIGRVVLLVPNSTMLRIDFEVDEWRRINYECGQRK